MALTKGKMTGLFVLCLCVIITSLVLAYSTGNVPGTTPSLNKKTKALIQAIVDSDAKPSTCEDLPKFLTENEDAEVKAAAPRPGKQVEIEEKYEKLWTR